MKRLKLLQEQYNRAENAAGLKLYPISNSQAILVEGTDIKVGTTTLDEADNTGVRVMP